MDEVLLDALLGESPVDVKDVTSLPIKQSLKCITDYQTHYPIAARRTYGGYQRPTLPEVTVCESLNINNGEKEYERMIEDMARMSLARTRGLMVEKRASQYERKQKLK
jgi:hypothetical protein